MRLDGSPDTFVLRIRRGRYSQTLVMVLLLWPEGMAYDLLQISNHLLRWMRTPSPESIKHAGE
jgi:hypothetical protein